jgi:AAHS family 4-hydroxybenzoate transporter-like MFS transporter
VPAETIDVGRTIDSGRWTAYQQWLVGLTALTIVFDGIDNQLLGVSLPSIMQEWSLPRAAFAAVISFSYLGMMIGGAIAGIAGDRYGRRTALLGSMVVFGGATVAAVLAGTPVVLAALRLIAGVGLGGAIPNAAALVAEYVPRSHRAMAVTTTIVCVPLGATVAGLLGSQLLDRTGWRPLFLVGGIAPLALAVILSRVLPESPRYLARHPDRRRELLDLLRRMGHRCSDDAVLTSDGTVPAERTPVAQLFRPELRRDTIALWASFMSCLLAVYLGFSWLPSLLASAGFSPAVASNGITAFNIGGVAGALGGGLAFARIGSRSAMLVMTAGAIAGAVLLSTMPLDPRMPLAPMFALLTLTGGLINAVQTTMYALAANVYASAVRATGVGFAGGVGRIGAILSGYAGAWAIEFAGGRSYFGLIAVAMCVCFVALAAVQRHVPPNR